MKPLNQGCIQRDITSNEVVLHPGKEMTERSNHEETDTWIIIHMIDAVKNNNTVLVHTGDRHNHNSGEIPRHTVDKSGYLDYTDIWITLGHGKNTRTVHVNRLAETATLHRC